MNDQTDGQTSSNRVHLDAVIALLPKPLRRKVKGLSDWQFNIGGIDVRLVHEGGMWGYDRKLPANRLKIDVPYEIKKALDDKVHNKSYKRRPKDGTYSYQNAATFIEKTLTTYASVMKERARGASKATRLGQQVKAAFAAEPLLGGLDLEVNTRPVLNTTNGEVIISFAERSDYTYNAIELRISDQADGFFGSIDVGGPGGGLSIEQVVALIVVLKADRLNLLDMIGLADDSILGPIIRRMTKQEETNEEGEDE
ncbi:MAG: hypothetical protein AB7L09_02655 [Nitrospira sp.]